MANTYERAQDALVQAGVEDAGEHLKQWAVAIIDSADEAAGESDTAEECWDDFRERIHKLPEHTTAPQALIHDSVQLTAQVETSGPLTDGSAHAVLDHLAYEVASIDSHVPAPIGV